MHLTLLLRLNVVLKVEATAGCFYTEVLWLESCKTIEITISPVVKVVLSAVAAMLWRCHYRCRWATLCSCNGWAQPRCNLRRRRAFLLLCMEDWGCFVNRAVSLLIDWLYAITNAISPESRDIYVSPTSWEAFCAERSFKLLFFVIRVE